MAATCVLALAGAACGNVQPSSQGGGSPNEPPRGLVVGASAAVYPLAEAANERLDLESSDAEIAIERSEPRTSFERLCAGEMQAVGSERSISSAEARRCRRNDISYTRFRVAIDAVAVATNQALPINCITTRQLKRLWSADSKVEKYNELDVRFPNQRVRLYGPPPGSPGFELFTKATLGEQGSSRGDYARSGDGSELVQGVASDTGALGYLGFAYLDQNRDKLNAVGIDAGDGCVKPSRTTIQSGEYGPLARPLSMYVSEGALRGEPGRALVETMLSRQQELTEAALLAPLSPQQVESERERLGVPLGP